MTIYRREASNAEEIAKLLRTRGRIVITAPAHSGKTTELLRYAESRYHNGRFAVVCAREEDRDKIIKAHWNIYNDISWADVIARRLLGQEMEGEEVNHPRIFVAPNVYFSNHCLPVFADDFDLLSNSVRRTIMKHALFIAAVGGKTNGTEED